MIRLIGICALIAGCALGILGGLGIFEVVYIGMNPYIFIIVGALFFFLGVAVLKDQKNT